MVTEKDLLEKIAGHLDSSRYENAALQAICSMLLAELSLLSPDPQAKLAQMSGALKRLADTLNTETDTDTFTRTIGLVVKGAFAGLKVRDAAPPTRSQG